MNTCTVCGGTGKLSKVGLEAYEHEQSERKREEVQRKEAQRVREAENERARSERRREAEERLKVIEDEQRRLTEQLRGAKSSENERPPPPPSQEHRCEDFESSAQKNTASYDSLAEALRALRNGFVFPCLKAVAWIAISLIIGDCFRTSMQPLPWAYLILVIAIPLIIVIKTKKMPYLGPACVVSALLAYQGLVSWTNETLLFSIVLAFAMFDPTSIAGGGNQK